MKISIGKNFEKRDSADLLILPFWEGPRKAFVGPKFEEFPPDFKGEKGEILFLYPKEEQEKRFLLLGLGKKENTTAETLRRAFAKAIKGAMQKRVKQIHVLFPETKWGSAVIDGIFLTNYEFLELKGEKKSSLIEKVTFLGLDSKWESEIDLLQKIATSVHFVRDLVNGNADDITPLRLVKEAKKVENKKLSVQVLSKKELEKEGMGLLLAVGRGARHEPHLIQMSYQGDRKSREHLLLIGKGITFDTGGLCLKPPDNMMTMKADMAGVATVLGVMKTAAELELKINMTALLPVAENAIGSGSYKLGDVYRACSGKTVEVLNTDAEGRLVLADAIAYGVKHLSPTAIIDVATLTGSIVVALGEEISGLFASDDSLAKDLEKAAEITGENLWRMPLYDYKEAIHSDIADIANVGGRDGGAIKAALFLQEFTDGVPWAHIDMAGPAYLSKPKYYSPTKATGWGVRLLLAFLELWTRRK